MGMYFFLFSRDENKSANSGLRYLTYTASHGYTRINRPKDIFKSLAETRQRHGRAGYDVQASDGRELTARLRILETLQSGFSLIVYAERPLLTEELQHALAIQPGALWIPWNWMKAFSQEGAYCCLSVLDWSPSTKRPDIIRLVHFTTQEFFVEKKTLTQANS